MHRLLILLPTLFAILAGTSCKTVSKIRDRYEDPSTSVGGVLLQPNGQALVYVRYENVNDKPLEIVEAVHQVAVDGVTLGEALPTRRSLTLPAHGFRSQNAVVTIRKPEVADRLRESLAAGAYNYSIRSQMTALTTDEDTKRFSSRASGELDFSSVPPNTDPAPSPSSTTIDEAWYPAGSGNEPPPPPVGTRMVPAITLPRD